MKMKRLPLASCSSLLPSWVSFTSWNQNRATYSVKDQDYHVIGGNAIGPAAEAGVGCEMKAGTGLASSLLPRKLRPRRNSVSLLQMTSFPVKTSLNHVNKLATQKLLAAPCVTPTNKFARTHLIQRRRSCGTTPLSPKTPCNVVCARKLKEITF